MFQHILVPLDGSTASLHALDQALLIASGEHARVDTLCLIDARLLGEARVYLPTDDGMAVSSEIASPSRVASIYQHWARQVADQARTRGEAASVPVRTRIATGLPYQEVIDASSGYDLLVVGPWELSAEYPGPFLAGSTWRQLVTHTRLPILTVRGPAREIRTILVAYDGSPQARDALQLAATWAYVRELKLIVLAVQEHGDQAQSLLWEARSRAHPVVPRLIARDGDPAEAILTVATDEQQCDLIAIGTYGNSSVLERLRRSAVDTVVQGSPLPVLLSH